MENLPHSYSRIFKFSDYKHSKKVVMKSSNENNESSVSHGSYVMISIAKVPTRFVGKFFFGTPRFIEINSSLFILLR